MVYLEKIENKLVKRKDSEGNTFLDIPRELTFTYIDEEGNKGYFSYNPYELSIELEENIIFFKLDDVMIDDILFDTINDLVNYIYDTK
jgi:hypothetical protein